MKKLFALFLAVCLFSNPAFAVEQWDKTDPAGTEAAADLDSLITTNNEAFDRLIGSYRRDCTVITDSSSTVKVLTGEIAIPNAAGTVVRFRKNTSTVSVSTSNLDTGASFTADSYHYVYAVADADATTFTVKVSLSSSAPSGTTYYRKIGYFYFTSSAIKSVGNVAGGDVSNSVTVEGTSDITTTASSATDMDDMTINYISSGRPVKVTFSAPMSNSSGNAKTYVIIDIDGTDEKTVDMDPADNDGGIPTTITWQGILSSGTHTIKAQWMAEATTTAKQNGSSVGPRTLIATEK